MASKNDQETRNGIDLDRDIDLLMVGKSGHGKSSTGNAILGRKEFPPSTDTGLGRCKDGVTQIDGRVIKIVDCPGLYSQSAASKEASVDHYIRAVSESFGVLPKGFHALLLVLSYTARMTEEEKDSIKALKSILGEDFIRNHAVVVITHGDSFLNDHEDGTVFKTWCREQEVYKDLFEECDSRVVLFDNATRDVGEKEAQLIELLSTIDSLKGNQKYTRAEFDRAEKTRDELIEELRLPSILESVSKKIRNVQRDIENIKENLEQLKKMKAEVVVLELEVPEGSHPKIAETKKEMKFVIALIDVYITSLVGQEKHRLDMEKLEKEITETRKRKMEDEMEQCQEMHSTSLLNKTQEESDGSRWSWYDTIFNNDCTLL